MSLLQHRQRDRFLQTGIHDRDHLASFVFGQSLRELVAESCSRRAIPGSATRLQEVGLLLNQRAEIRIESPGQDCSLPLHPPTYSRQKAEKGHARQHLTTQQPFA